MNLKANKTYEQGEVIAQLIEEQGQGGLEQKGEATAKLVCSLKPEEFEQCGFQASKAVADSVLTANLYYDLEKRTWCASRKIEKGECLAYSRLDHFSPYGAPPKKFWPEIDNFVLLDRKEKTIANKHYRFVSPCFLVFYEETSKSGSSLVTTVFQSVGPSQKKDTYFLLSSQGRQQIGRIPQWHGDLDEVKLPYLKVDYGVVDISSTDAIPLDWDALKSEPWQKNLHRLLLPVAPNVRLIDLIGTDGMQLSEKTDKKDYAVFTWKRKDSQRYTPAFLYTMDERRRDKILSLLPAITEEEYQSLEALFLTIVGFDRDKQLLALLMLTFMPNGKTVDCVELISTQVMTVYLKICMGDDEVGLSLSASQYAFYYDTLQAMMEAFNSDEPFEPKNSDALDYIRSQYSQEQAVPKTAHCIVATRFSIISRQVLAELVKQAPEFKVVQAFLPKMDGSSALSQLVMLLKEQWGYANLSYKDKEKLYFYKGFDVAEQDPSQGPAVELVQYDIAFSNEEKTLHFTAPESLSVAGSPSRLMPKPKPSNPLDEEKPASSCGQKQDGAFSGLKKGFLN